MERAEKIAEEVAKRLFVELEASGRHVHVTAQTAKILFGHGLTPSVPCPSRGSTWPGSG